MKNILRKNEQLSFDDLLGTDIKFFNKDENTVGSYKKRGQALEHTDECECDDCFRENLLK